MPVESVPSLRFADRPSSATDAGARPALARIDLAPEAEVEPVLRSARSALASLTLRARSAEQEAERAERAIHDGPAQEAVDAQRAEQLAAVEVEVEGRRARRDREIEAARRDAEAMVTAARAESAALVAEARAELDRSLARLGQGPVEPATAVSADAAAGAVAGNDAGDGATDEPRGPGTERSSSTPTYPPPAPTPVPTPTPPVAPAFAVPGVTTAMTYSTVLVQAPDGSLQPALVLNPMGQPTAQPLMTAVQSSPAPIARPAEVLEGAVVAAPSGGGMGRRLLHLDVILPLIAVLIVLVVLLAWLG